MTEQMNDYYIYLHVKETNGDPFYIGKGSKRRAYNKGGRSSWWRYTTKKYGYDVIILEENLSENESNEREIYWIKRIGRIKKNEGTLINLTDGGEGSSGHKHSEESKKKMSEAALGRIITEDARKKISIANKGKKLSKETKQKISIKNKNYTSDRKKIALEKSRKIRIETGIRIKEMTTGVEFNLVDSYQYFDIPKETIAKNSLIGNPLRSKKFNGLNFTRIKGQKKNDPVVLNILPVTRRESSGMAKTVLDLSTGIFWKTIFEASIVYSIEYSTLKRKLLGKKINDTNLILV